MNAFHIPPAGKEVKPSPKPKKIPKPKPSQALYYGRPKTVMKGLKESKK